MNFRQINLYLLLSTVVLGATVVGLLACRQNVQPVPVLAQEMQSVSAPAPAPPQLRSYAMLTTPADWRQWIGALRDAGVPVRVLAGLVRDGFNDQWQQRQAQAQAAYSRGDMDADGLAAMNIEHDGAQEAAMRAALGEEDFQKWDKQNVLQGINLHGIQLSDAETDALYDLQKKYQQDMAALQAAKLKGQMDLATYNEKQAKERSDYNARLKVLLGDQRYATMQGGDDGSGDLQRDLGGQSLPENVSFDSLLQLQNAWNQRRDEMQDKINDAQGQLANYQQELTKLDAQREQQLQSVLGTNVFNALEAGQDSRYQDMKRYAGTWGLDDTSIAYVYQNIKYAEKALGNYQSRLQAAEAQGQDVDWDAAGRNMQQFVQQNEQVLRNYLGNDRFDQLKKNQILPSFTGQ